MAKIPKYFLFIALNGFYHLTVLGQQYKIDSLKFALKNVKTDTSRIKILFLLVENINDDKIWAQYNEEALKIAERLIANNNPVLKRKGKRAMASAINNKGFLYDNQGNLLLSLDFYNRGLKIQEEIGDTEGIATSLNNIASIYSDQEDMSTALDYLRKGLVLFKKIDSKIGIARSLNNIGSIYRVLDSVPKALIYFRNCLQICEEINDKEGIANALNSIGYILTNQGNLKDALQYNKKSLKLREEIDDKPGIAFALNSIGDVYIRQAIKAHSIKDKRAMIALARSYSDSSLKKSITDGYPENIRYSEQVLTKIDSVTGNYAGAIAHYKQFIVYRDSISNKETRKASIKSQLKYEYEKKEAVLNEKQEKEHVLAEEKSRFQLIIIWAVLGGLVLVIIFAAFVFRTLKVTRQQKEIIFEKQREILDSIHYAKRIQTALITNENYIHKALTRLQKTK